MNKRREILVALGAGAIAMPFGSFAQQQNKVWRVGFLSQRAIASLDSDPIGTFPRGMRELGYIEGKTLVIEWRSADGNYDRLAALSAELAQLNVDVIVANGTPSALALQKVTSTIPVVMVAAADPVGVGLVKSLGRPEANITGVSNLFGELGPKLLEILQRMVPKLSRVAVLTHPDNAFHGTLLKQVQFAGDKNRITILHVEARNPQGIESAFTQMARQNVGALLVVQDSYFIQQRRQLAELASKHRLASISGYREYAEGGGLASYGPSVADLWHRAATYVDKIIKGVKPADLPVEQPTKLELIINAKTAKALGLKIPQSLLISADKVIE